jgi:hypothetical protein
MVQGVAAGILPGLMERNSPLDPAGCGYAAVVSRAVRLGDRFGVKVGLAPTGSLSWILLL